MKKATFVLLFLSILLAPLLHAGAKGYLFIIGGGSRPESMTRRFVELASQFGEGKIIVFPMASAEPAEVGSEQAAELKNLGAKDVECRILTREQALEKEQAAILDGAGGVFFSGGVQSRLMDILLDTPVHHRLLEFYEQGGVIGGTSAGAAVLSEIMITGDERRQVKEGHEFETIEVDNIVTAAGLGFLKTAIVDQHFVTRKRHNRLISLMAEHPHLLGIGVDESTAAIVGPNETLEVLGKNCVVIYDARAATINIRPGGLVGISDLVMHVLVPGDRFDLKARKVVR
jgi:cyanophycinase